MSGDTEQVYTFLDDFIEEHGYSPNIREIATACLMNSAKVTRYLDRLESRGRIQREVGKARSIRLMKPQAN